MIFERKLEVLFSQDQIRNRVAELGATITRDYQGRTPILIGVLKGSFIFMADLCRHIDLPISVDFLALSSYGDETTSSGEVRLTQDLSRPVHDQDLIIVEDIVDTGLTMKYLLKNLASRGPRSVRVCSLLSKPSRRTVEVDIDYLGFDIEDRFVVGYGLDYASRYRNLPYIGAIEEKD